MAALRLKGTITEDRQLQVDLPANIPPGEVEIILEFPFTWTDEERQTFQAETADITPQSGAEIVAWLQSLEGGTGWESVSDGALMR